VGVAYLHGIGAEKDRTRAQEWAERAALKGVRPAKGFLEQLKREAMPPSADQPGQPDRDPGK
jgi:TPR repeat protein